MKLGVIASRATGISDEHAGKAFQKVADKWHCVVISRAVGKACTGLIREGYASKGFHVKAKSCNWGPMAGFLLEDYRLTKRKRGVDDKGWKKQEKDIEEPFKRNFCSFTPLLISEDRVKFVLQSGYARLKDKTISVAKLPDKFDVEADSPDSELFSFTLVKDKAKKQVISLKPEKKGSSMWGVYFAKDADVHQREKKEDKNGLIPVRAIVNKKDAVPENIKNAKLIKRYHANLGWVDGYRGACTGDYDLFAIFPPTASMAKSKKQPGWAGNIPFEMEGVDIRPVKLGIRGAKAKKLLEREHPDYGNMTARIYMIRDDLNTAFQAVDKWTDRIMVHHSDEGGRPFWPELDYPLHAFVPNDKDHYAIENQKDLVGFFKRIDKLGYKIVIPPNWEDELGLKKIHLNYEVPKWSKDIRKRADLVRQKSSAQSIADAFAEPKPLALLNGMKVLFDESVPVQPVNLVPKDKSSLESQH
ncbi:MAG: anthrax toxin-like adenylyl cyclase domain-containing protein [Pseudomonadales bacterium]